MTFTLGSTDINRLYLGSTEIKKAYHGSSLIHDMTSGESSGTSFDISAAAYNSVNYDMSGEDTTPQGMFLSQSGEKLYVIGLQNDSVYEYDLGTANDLSSISYSGNSFDVSSQDSVPFGLFFNGDLTKMYVMGNSDAIYQYTLSSAGDVSTASYDSVFFDFSAQSAVVQDLFIDDTGTTMFLLDVSNYLIHQYTLSTAWDISTASYDSASYDPTGTLTPGAGFIFSPNMATMVITGSDEIIYQFTLSSPGDITTAAYDGVNYDASWASNQAAGLTISSDGTKMFWIRNSSPETIYEFDL